MAKDKTEQTEQTEEIFEDQDVPQEVNDEPVVISNDPRKLLRRTEDARQAEYARHADKREYTIMTRENCEIWDSSKKKMRKFKAGKHEKVPGHVKYALQRSGKLAVI